MTCETEIKSSSDQIESNSIKSRKKRMSENKCSQFERKIMNPNLPYRMNQKISTDPIVTPDLLQDFGMKRLYNKTCSFVQIYKRRCGDFRRYREISPDECMKKCLENRKCYTSQYFPGNRIWKSDDRSVCFLFPLGVRDCPWAGGEDMTNLTPEERSQIKMIECTKPKCSDSNDTETCKDVWSSGHSWFDAYCDYNWRYHEGIYHYECTSCEYIYTVQDCESSVSCLNACFGIRNLFEYEARLTHPKPEDYNLTSEYKFASTTWGSVFYRLHPEKLDRMQAQQLCEYENAFLPVPLSEQENNFLLTLGMRHNWIGVQVQRKTWLGILGTSQKYWRRDNGNDVNWFNWEKNEPNTDIEAEVGVVIMHNGQWTTRPKHHLRYVACWYIHERYMN